LIAGCASNSLPDINVDHMAGYDFARVKTFAYLPKKGGPSASGFLSDMEVARMHRAFAAALAARGMVLVEDRERADILASWHLVTQEQTDVRSYNSSTYYQCWGCGPSVSDVSVRQYTRGTLIFDLVDPDLRKSVWRGVMQSRISEKRPSEGQQELFNSVAEAMLKNYPPGQGQ
jgi:hypothetical protein